MEERTRQTPEMTEETIRAVNEIIHRRNQAEIKVEGQKLVVIEIQRKKRV